jgi:hypothetical protein
MCAAVSGVVKLENVTLAARGDGGWPFAPHELDLSESKGTIRAFRVKLQNGGSVEGDIYHRSLSIDENSLFEGSSRRVENPTDGPLVDAKSPQASDMRSSVLAPYLQRVEPSASPDWSDSAVEPKH